MRSYTHVLLHSTVLLPCQAFQFLFLLLRWLVLKLLLSWLFSGCIQVLLKLYGIITHFIIHCDEILLVTWHLVMLRQGVWCASYSPEKLKGSICQWAQIKDHMHDLSRPPSHPQEAIQKAAPRSDWELLATLWSFHLCFLPRSYSSAFLWCALWQNQCRSSLHPTTKSMTMPTLHLPA